MNMPRTQTGFTLIELIMVIVILGILAATALPRFIDLSTEAEAAAMEGVVGAANSAMAINYAACMAGSAQCVTVEDCADVDDLLVGGLPDDYSPTEAEIDGNGTVVSCTITHTTAPDGTFQGIGAGQ